MRLLYNLGIWFYYILILIVSPFNAKARSWIRGRRGLFQRISKEVNPDRMYTWIHCSSLGEFEQGRPVIEKIREKNPDTKILLTFYSPSGYAVRKDYDGADHVFYLPLDTKANAKRFLELIPIEQAFFVKYEFWYNFLTRLHEKQTPVYLVSGIFRKDQVFFKWYGAWYRRILGLFKHLFVQQASSLELLASIGIRNASVSGDTRFDRVYQIARNVHSDDRFVNFCGKLKVVVAGSTWPADEEILAQYLNESRHSCKWLIAPHEIHESGIERLEKQIMLKTQRYTFLNQDEIEDTQVIIIDTIGMLSSLYQYAHITYIGGGFGKGIHNTLEAATFGNPVVFGPNYHKFQEAKDLVSREAAFPVSGFEEFRSVLDNLLNDEQWLKTSGKSSEEYVKSMLGASSKIVDFALKTKTE